MNNEHKKEKISEILLDILIGVFIILILISVYTQFIAEKKDQTRIRDLSSMNSAIAKLQEVNLNFFLGEPNKVYPIKSLQSKFNRVYISLPSPNANCDNLELPSLPDGWEYRCKPETEYRRIDGNGWLPVNFTQLPKDFDFKSSLPIDPTNMSDSGYYYAYIVGEDNNWVLTSLLESNKYLKETAFEDNGTDPARFEIGSDLQLWAKASGLVGYWKFDEGQGQTAYDASGNSNNGTLGSSASADSADPKWTAPAPSNAGRQGKSLLFDGVDDYVDAGNDASLNITGNITIEAWVKPNIDHTFSMVSKNTYHQDYDFVYRTDTDVLELNYRTPNLYTPQSTSFVLNVNVWNHFAVSLNCDTKIASFYVNGKAQGNQSVAECPNNYYKKPLLIGSRKGAGTVLNGAIDEVKIYNRALSAKEVWAIFNATK